MCCVIGALLVATIAAWRRLLQTASGWRPSARWVTAVAIALGLAAGSASAARHLGHYAMRAEASGRGMLAEILAQPICLGSAGARVVRLD